MSSVLGGEADRDVRISVVGCQGLINKDTEHLSELTDPLVAVFEGNNAKPILITPVITNTLFPTWDEESASVDVRVTSGTVLTFQVWHRVMSDKEGSFLGELKVTADRMIGSNGGVITDLLHARIKEPNALVKALSESADPNKRLGAISIAWDPRKAISSRHEAYDASKYPVLGVLSVLSAKNLLRRDTAPSLLSDPYVTVSFPTRKRVLWTSATIDCTLNPKWADLAEAYLIELQGEPSATVLLEVWNANPRPERDSFLGTAIVKVSDLKEGSQKLHLTPRPNETDGIIKRLDGRLGWVVVDWKPLHPPLVAQCRERARNEELGLSAGSDGVVRVAQWTPTELNEYLNTLRRGTPQVADPTGAHGTTGISSSSPTTSAPLIPFHELSKFSPYYPHDGSRRPGVTVVNPPREDNPVAAPLQGGNDATHFTSQKPSLLQTSAANTTVAVDMTDLIPIRVVYAGQFYDTELHADEKLSRIQDEAREMFLVHNDMQLFFHNGDLKDPNLSLRHNGCLLLKGDPHIKLTMAVAKGSMRNLIFVFPDHREVALAVSELSTVRQVKDMLCDDYGGERGLEELLDDPREFKFLYRYTELNDKATIQYYNIPTNSKIQVSRRPKFSFDRQKEDVYEVDDRRPQPTTGSKRLAATASGVRHEAPSSASRKSSTTSGQAKPVNAELKDYYDHHQRQGVISPRGRSADGRPPSGRSVSADKAGKRSSSTDRRPTSSSPSNHSTNPAAKRRGEEPTGMRDPRPRGYYELERDGSAIDDPELATLRRTVRELEQQVRQQSAQQTAAQQLEQEKRVAKLERELTISETRYREALQRITELEASVQRYQGLLQRATQLNVM